MLPETFINSIKDLLKEDTEVSSFLACQDLPSYRALRINPLKCNEDTGSFLRSLPGMGETVPWEKSGIYYTDTDYFSPGKSPFQAAGAYYIQEPSAMSPVPALMEGWEEDGALPVLDLCAAPGGKSTQIASYMAGRGIILTNEVIKSRATILSENIERMAIANALVISEDPYTLSERFPEGFGRILVDAPCSGEGMFRKTPSAISEWSPENVEICASRQRDILGCAYEMLAPGGRMVYSTCTFSIKENEENAKWFVSEYEDMELLAMDRIWPHKAMGEGHFYAVFRKKGEPMAVNPAVFRSVDTQAYSTQGYKKNNNKNVALKRQGKRGREVQTISIDSALEMWRGFADSVLLEDPFKAAATSRFILFGDNLYVTPTLMPNLKGLRVLRPGLHIGSVKKERFEPSHALALYLSPSMVRCCREVEWNGREAAAYIHGETLENVHGYKGWILVHTKALSLGWGKGDRGIIKNHYPKGLRT